MELTEQQKQIIVYGITAVLLALIGWLAYVFVGVAVKIFVVVAPWAMLGAIIMYILYKYQNREQN